MLLLHRRLPAAQVTAGKTVALPAGSCSPDVVAIEARKQPAVTGQPGEGPWPALRPRPSRAAVVTLPRRRGLGGFERESAAFAPGQSAAA